MVPSSSCGTPAAASPAESSIVLNVAKVFIQLYVTKLFVDRTLQPMLHSSFLASILLILSVVVIIEGLAIVAMALTFHLAAVAFLWMQPGNVVPILDDDRYERMNFLAAVREAMGVDPGGSSQSSIANPSPSSSVPTM